MSRLIVLIVEGFSLELYNKWKNYAPFNGIEGLETDGNFGDFESLSVPYEASCLLSLFTGYSPKEHGCYSFWKIHGNRFTENPSIFLHRHKKKPFIWETPEGSRLRVNLVNLFGTHPPNSVNGSVISYPLQSSTKTCYPADLLYKLHNAGIRYSHDVSSIYAGKPLKEFTTFLLKIEEARLNASLNLLMCHADLNIFNFTIIDRLSHFAWHETELNQTNQPDTCLWRAYEFINKAIIRIRTIMKQDDNLLVVSEIGFGPLKRFISINDYLSKNHLLKFSDGKPVSAGSFAMESVQGSHGINLNLERRYKDGVIKEKEEDRYFDEVIDCLSIMDNPETGERLFKNVLKQPPLGYPNADDSPDIICIPYDERYLPLGNPYWATRVHRNLQTGWHRRNSFWAGIGPRFNNRISAKANCTDITRTITDCLNMTPVSNYGRSLCSAAT